MHRDLTKGNITSTMLWFALPMALGNLLQQLYNVADTFIVSWYLGFRALGAVGSSFTLMTFLTSILLGLCMGSGVVFSIRYSRGEQDRLRQSIFLSFVLIGLLAMVLTAGVFALLDPILGLLRVDASVYPLMRAYLWVVFWGIPATFLYNFFSNLLRSVGNSLTPLLFLGISALINIGLDLWFIRGLEWGVEGAAVATVIAQYLSGLGVMVYTWICVPALRVGRKHLAYSGEILRELSSFSLLTCVQQSVMNLGILMVQGLVNSFGPVVMAAFAAAVKIDAFAYMPVQDFGNAFSTFIAQNYGAGRMDRIRGGIRSAFLTSTLFCLVITAVVWLAARPLMLLFVQPQDTEVLAVGIRYLRIEGAFYCGIGWLFLLYGLYRAVAWPAMSVILTFCSLGTRVVLAYTLAPLVGTDGIWWSVPIGWLLADAVGALVYLKSRKKLEQSMLSPHS
ncbi:MAG: MATE family efflux transporter [Eubacteriales bacterium]|jgi:putative MATE family efflux protein